MNRIAGTAVLPFGLESACMPNTTLEIGDEDSDRRS
jgi:hypothetical protein